jgi:hypothetical protein
MTARTRSHRLSKAFAAIACASRPDDAGAGIAFYQLPPGRPREPAVSGRFNSCNIVCATASKMGPRNTRTMPKADHAAEDPQEDEDRPLLCAAADQVSRLRNVSQLFRSYQEWLGAHHGVYATLG